MEPQSRKTAMNKIRALQVEKEKLERVLNDAGVPIPDPSSIQTISSTTSIQYPDSVRYVQGLLEEVAAKQIGIADGSYVAYARLVGAAGGELLARSQDKRYLERLDQNLQKIERRIGVVTRWTPDDAAFKEQALRLRRLEMDRLQVAIEREVLQTVLWDRDRRALGVSAKDTKALASKLTRKRKEIIRLTVLY